MKLLVTGGAGFIGSHTCKSLYAAGFDPVVYDDLSSGHRDAVQWGTFVRGDVRDSSALLNTMLSHRPAAVIHFAAVAYVGESMGNPAKYYSVNVGGTQTLLDACRQAAISTVVFSSSCATYGVPDTLPVAENAPQLPISPYGNSKLTAERMIFDYARSYGFRSVILRYFNAAGADPDGQLSERHDPETHLIPLALLAAAGKTPHLRILGNDYPTPDGTCIRDYVHVTDLAASHVLALKHLLGGGRSSVMNIGAGRPTSVIDILDTIQRVTGRVVPTLAGHRRDGDPPELVADIRLAKEILGFAPRLSDVETIIRTAAPTFGLDAEGVF